MNRPLVTSGGCSGRADLGGAGRLAGLAAEVDGGTGEARDRAARVTCPLCQGQATVGRGRVFIAHRPRCPRSTTGRR